MAERDPQIATGRNYPAYDEDFAAWLAAQATMLRERRFDELDVEHLAEEWTAWEEVSSAPSPALSK